VLNWLRSTIDGWLGLISRAIREFVHAVVGAVVGALESLFRNVTGAWDDLVTAARELESSAWHLGRALWHQLDRIITYWVPHFAMTAWWWVTHPDQLAHVLYWHTIRYLETYAWQTGRYLGEFATALVVANLRRFTLLVEDIIHAVL
jgi:hypothetical protein